jgi:dienelactone hydrolase
MLPILSQFPLRFRGAAVALSLGAATVISVCALPVKLALAQIALVPAQSPATFLGPEQAKGAVIWSHGRSIDSEDSAAPTPGYMTALRDVGWDTFRLNRPRMVDTLEASGAALAEEADALKRAHYRRVVLAGQSFGGFISLIAAGESDAVDAVIATAPAAYGNVESNPGGYGLNAVELYRLLRAVRHARVALFFFAKDIFDPGGRGVAAERILAARHLPHLVIDRPPSFSTHWAAGTSFFAQHFGGCLVAFAAGDGIADDSDCRAPDTTLQLAGLPAP